MTALRLKLSGMIGARQQRFSDRLHLSGDAYARPTGGRSAEQLVCSVSAGGVPRSTIRHSHSHHGRAGRVTTPD